MSRLQQIEKQIAELEYERQQLSMGAGIAGQSETKAWAPDTLNQASIAMPRDPIDDIFTFHDNPGALPHYVEIRESAKTFARVIDRHAPWGDDKRKALNFVRAAVMWANAAVALNGRQL